MAPAYESYVQEQCSCGTLAREAPLPSPKSRSEASDTQVALIPGRWTSCLGDQLVPSSGRTSRLLVRALNTDRRRLYPIDDQERPSANCKGCRCCVRYIGKPIRASNASLSFPILRKVICVILPRGSIRARHASTNLDYVTSGSGSLPWCEEAAELNRRLPSCYIMLSIMICMYRRAARRIIGDKPTHRAYNSGQSFCARTRRLCACASLRLCF